jgi:predicted nuclease of predicted toxin-antitoxin system
MKLLIDANLSWRLEKYLKVTFAILKKISAP